MRLHRPLAKNTLDTHITDQRHRARHAFARMKVVACCYGAFGLSSTYGFSSIWSMKEIAGNDTLRIAQAQCLSGRARSNASWCHRSRPHCPGQEAIRRGL